VLETVLNHLKAHKKSFTAPSQGLNYSEINTITYAVRQVSEIISSAIIKIIIILLLLLLF